MSSLTFSWEKSWKFEWVELNTKFKSRWQNKQKYELWKDGFRNKYIITSFSENAIRNGLDVLVGTPGRILDYVRKGSLNLSKLQHVVLDEVDQMLDMGFAESVDEILQSAYNKEGWFKFL